ncbi:MAG: hypothetical protein BIFFINMI_02966 [Phycisphaerae bacterium]|nr:hypothetical protein [Phycisphaerae bacterium]
MPLLAALAAMLLPAAGAARGDDGPVNVSYSYWSKAWTLKFPGDPYSFTYPASGEFPGDMGSTGVARDDGGTIIVPNYVLNARMSLNAARAYFDSHGLPCKSPPSTVSFVTMEEYSGLFTPGYFWDSIEIDGRQSATWLLAVPVHEWFHAVQRNNWGAFAVSRISQFTGRSSYDYKVAVEGTAEWATDLPIRLTPRGISRSMLGLDGDGPASVVYLGQINTYYTRRYTWAQPDMRSRGVFEDYLTDKERKWTPYLTVFFWKSFARRTGGGEKDLEIIKKFWEALASRNYRGRSQLIESIGSQSSRPGGRDERFRKIYEDYVADAIAQVDTTGAAGFNDDAFFEMDTTYFTTDRTMTGYYSTRPTEIPPADADSDSEVHRRLAAIATKVSGARPLGFRAVALQLSDKAPPDKGATHLFLMARGDQPRPDAWGAVALTHFGKDPELRGNKAEYRDGVAAGPIRMDRLNFSLQEPTGTLDSRPLAYFHLRNFNRLDQCERIWVGLIDTDDQDKAQFAELSYAATPFFAPLVAPDAPASDASKLTDSRAVQFISSRPARNWPDEGFHPGDTLTVRVCVSDDVHIGSGVNIQPEQRTLAIEVQGGDGKPMEVTDDGLDAVADGAAGVFAAERGCRAYDYRFTLPQPMTPSQEGRCRIRFTVSSLLRLGREDRSEDRTFAFDVSQARPAVANVEFRRPGEPYPTRFYDSLSGAMKPITPGEVNFDILFDRDMNKAKPADVKLNDESLTGQWADDGRHFRGSFTVPDGAAFASAKGVRRLSVQAESATGTLMDADPQAGGDQPDTSHRVVVDAVPPMVASLDVVSASGKFYDARWAGGPDAALQRSWLDRDVEEARRELELPVAEMLPEGGHVASVTVNLTQPLSAPPKVTVGKQTIAMKQAGHDRVWSGQLDVDALRDATPRYQPIPVVIEATDIYGNALDAHPATVARLKLPESGAPAAPGNWWIGYEADFAGPEAGHGGPDRNHRLNAYTQGDEWLDEDVKQGDKRYFHMVQRGAGVQVFYGSNVYDGSVSGGHLSVFRRNRTVQELVDSKWYINYKLVSTPPRRTLEQVMARYGPAGQVGSSYEMDRRSDDEWRGNSYGISIRYDESSGDLRHFSARGDPWPHIWTRIKPAPSTQPDEEAKPPPKPYKPAKLVEFWNAYRLDHRVAGGLHMIDIRRVRFRRYDDDTAWLEVYRYPVSYLTNEQTGRTGFNIQWNSQDVDVFKRAQGKEQADLLSERAAAMRTDSFPREQANARVQAILGPDSTPLYP